MDLSGEDPYGEVKQVFREERTARFDWKIPDFPKLRPGGYFSPTSNYFNMRWCLGINTEQDGIRHVCLFRVLATPGFLESVRFSIGWRRADGRVVDITRGQTLPENSDVWFLAPSRPCYEPSSDQLTLTCILRKGDSPHAEGVSRETQTEDTGFKDKSALSVHFENLLLSGDHHDLLVRVKDRQFRAHKCVLARSPVFAAMFGDKTSESAEGSVTIEDCDPDAFGQFLRYVYTGEVDIASKGHALGLYYAGVKYDLPGLKDICVEFLKKSLTTSTVFDAIHWAARHDEEELQQQAMVYLSTHLEEVMLTVECQRSLVGNLVQANEMCLEALQCLKTSLCHK